MTQTDQPSPTILVVDDEPEITRMLALYFGRYDLTVKTAQNGPMAVQVYREVAGSIALVLLDMQMLGPWDGLRTLHELRQVDPLVRVAFMTGSPGGYSPETLLELGALAILPKPFPSIPALAAKLRELLQSTPT